MEGKLICLSGLDGSGKTTQVELLKNYFQKNGLRVNDIHLKHVEISMLKIKERCKKYIEKQEITDQNIIRNIFSAINFVEKVSASIMPSLDENDITIVNRYIDSAKCYHHLKNGLSDYVEDIYYNLPSPTFNLFIDVSPEVCFVRIKSRTVHNEFESLPNLVKAFEFYKHRKENFIWIDGMDDKQSIFSNILKIIDC